MNCKKNNYMILFSMCIIFFNKKIKLDKLTDIMSTKVVKNIKMDTKISIPNDFVALIYYKDCYLFSLDSGEYKFDKNTFGKVIEKNKRRNRNIKKPTFNFNLHFISTKDFNINMQFKAINSFKDKNKYSLSANYSILNPLAFSKEILITWYKTTNNRTLSYIKDWFKEFSEYLVRKYDKVNLNNSQMLLTFSNRFFKKLGISINNIRVSSNKSTFFEPINTPITNEKVENNNVSFNSQSNNEKYCPKCQAKLIQGSAYCVRCGHSLQNQISFK